MRLLIFGIIVIITNVQSQKSLTALKKLKVDLNKNHIYLVDINEFESFKSKHGKFYQGDSKEVSAVMTYLDNKKRVKEFNAKSKNLTFTVGTWEYSDLNQTEIKEKLAGYKALPRRKYMYKNSFPSNVPASLNYTAKGWVSKVTNQGLCSSCWAFSSAGSFEGQYAKKTGTLATFSMQNLVDCNRNDVNGNWGCNGGNMLTAFEFLMYKQKGLNLLSQYKYTAVDGKCSYNRSRALGTVLDYVEVAYGNETLLMYALAAVGPLSVAVDSSSFGFQSYKSGVFNDPSAFTEVDHAVLLVGYGTDPVGGDYWLVKNSWGTSWGELGYIRIARNRGNICGIAEFITYPIVTT